MTAAGRSIKKRDVMRQRALLLGASALMVAIAGSGGGVQAQPDHDPNAVVARVGTEAITVGEMERRMARIPRFQLATFGETPEQIRRGFLDKVLVPEYLMSQGARQRGVDSELDTRVRERDVLKSSVLKQLRAEGAEKIQISDVEIAKYYQDHKAEFDSPPRYAIWRILVPTRADADRVLAEVHKDPSPKNWQELARKHSLDKATAMKGGALGWVTEAGDTTDAKIKVDKAVVEAAKGVKDGEFAHPVQEGSGWAVVWRRSYMPEQHRTLEQEGMNIRQNLQHERAMESQTKTIAALKEKYVTGVNPQALELLEVSSSGQVGARGKPGRVYRKPAAGGPEQTPRGLR